MSDYGVGDALDVILAFAFVTAFMLFAALASLIATIWFPLGWWTAATIIGAGFLGSFIKNRMFQD